MFPLKHIDSTVYVSMNPYCQQA